MANPSLPYFGIWRLFIDESRTKSNDFYEIDDINTFGAGASYQIAECTTCQVRGMVDWLIMTMIE
jgi:hypothetical protein